MKKSIAIMMVVLVALVVSSTGVASAREGTFYELTFVDDFEFKDDERLSGYGYDYDDGSTEAYIDVLDVATIMIFERPDGECRIEITEHHKDGDEVVHYADGYTLDKFNNDEELHKNIIAYIAAILMIYG